MYYAWLNLRNAESSYFGCFGLDKYLQLINDYLLTSFDNFGSMYSVLITFYNNDDSEKIYSPYL